MDLVWSLLLIGHRYFTGTQLGLQLQIISKEHVCDEIKLCAQIVDIVLGSIVNTIEKIYVSIPRAGESSLSPLITLAPQL